MYNRSTDMAELRESVIYNVHVKIKALGVYSNRSVRPKKK